jgi:hypothetical protein
MGTKVFPFFKGEGDCSTTTEGSLIPFSSVVEYCFSSMVRILRFFTRGLGLIEAFPPALVKELLFDEEKVALMFIFA